MLLTIALCALIPAFLLEEAPVLSPREASVRSLTEALERRSAESDPQRLARLSQAVVDLRSELGMEGGGWMLSALLEETAERAASDTKNALRELSSQLSVLAEDLMFEPLIEAQLPLGFPAPTPVHSIARKTYPAYRMANTPSKGSQGGGAFWTLFRHIQSNKVEMTAPVEMTYGARGEALVEERMAFLYGDPELGEVGSQGAVEVVDIAPMEVLSLGCRGRSSRRRVEAGLALLENWLSQHPELEAAGPVRSMGYNSPMVPVSRSYFEVQLPIRRKPAETTADEASLVRVEADSKTRE
jgi:hypothetical protein